LAQIFRSWTNKLPLILAASGLAAVILVVGFFWYYGSPWYTDVGYRPRQPVPYSHKLHAGDLGIDCRYCHYSVERSASANVPPTSVCMNCHKLILPESEKLLPVRESWASGEPIKWVRIHKIGEYAYFNHSIHINRGVSCISCHGNVAQMEVVVQKQPLSMGWCLNCHRNPSPYLRPVEEVTNMNWMTGQNQAEYAARIIREKKIAPPEDCSACHR